MKKIVYKYKGKLIPMQKTCVVTIFFMLVFSFFTVFLPIETCNASGNTIYVDDDGGADYTKIQDAIDNATTGDTIFVYSGTYYENIVINKMINLTGQNRETTTIDASDNGIVVLITVGGVDISGFSVQNGISGIFIENSDDNKVFSNIIKDNGASGIYIGNSKNSQIENNKIESNPDGIILVSNANGNTIVNNDIKENTDCGIELVFSSNNLIYHNNFIDNAENAYDPSTNTWDNGYPSGGNYWSDYTGEDADGDGIGDAPYSIPGYGGSNQDNYPFINQDGWLNELPIADAGGPYSGNPGNETTFDGSNSNDPDGTIISFRWDFENDGTYDTGWLETAITTRSYSTTGTFTVKLQVKDNNETTDTDTGTVTISGNIPPVANAGGPYSGNIGQTIIFDGSLSTDSDGTINSYVWDFGDGATGSGITTTHTYSSIGDYTVTLTVIDNDGSTDIDTTLASIAETPIKEYGLVYGKVLLQSNNINFIGKNVTVCVCPSEEYSGAEDIILCKNICVTTNENGRYSIPSIETGTYIILAVKSKLYTSEEFIEIKVNKSIEVNFTIDISETRSEIERSIEYGYVGGELNIAQETETDYEYEIIIYDGVKIDPIEINESKISIIINGDENITGRTIAITTTLGMFDLTNDLVVEYDGEAIRMADDTADVLNPNNDGIHAEYLITIGTDGIEILISIPHFSEHMISITTLPPEVMEEIVEAIGGIHAIILYMLICVIASALFIGTIYIRRRF